MRLGLLELAHRHVHVTTVCPSYVATGLFAGARAPRLSRMLTAERVAAEVVRAVRRDRAFVRTPWFRYFLDYDPAPTLARVSCPVLALFGERDLQVPADTNRGVMEEIFRKSGNPDWTIKVIPGANHLYQAATTGSASEYPRLPKEFVPAFTDTLLAWLSRQAKPR